MRKPRKKSSNGDLKKEKTQIESIWNSGEFEAVGQDWILVSLLRPDRLLELVRHYVFFVQGIGKMIARYHQFFGVRRLYERIINIDSKGKRSGGVIWHTTGSGKSYTMMLLSKYLLLSEKLNQCRFLVVTDRKDLQSQLRKNFKQSGAFGGSIGSKDADKAAVSTGKDLAQRIGKGNERILFTLIQKFNTAVREPNCRNDSPDLIVLVDEGHRTNSGQLHQQMKKALPNASFVAFTGTPL